MRKRILFGVALLGMLSVSVQSFAQEVTLRLSANDRPDGHVFVAGKILAERVAERTGGRLKIELFPNHTLASGSFKTEMELLRGGIIDISLLSTIIAGLFVDRRFDVYSLPFLIDDHEVAIKVIDGPLGDATVAKLITNMMCFVHQVAFSEGMMLGARAGLELEPLWRVIKASYAGSFVAEVDGEKLLNGNFDPEFPLALACKDMRLTGDLARELDVPMELSVLTEKIYARARAQYGEDTSCNSVMRLIEDAVGVQLRAEIE